MDAEDVEHLLPPLLNLLDGRKDFPIPKDKEKGLTFISRPTLDAIFIFIAFVHLR